MRLRYESKVGLITATFGTLRIVGLNTTTGTGRINRQVARTPIRPVNCLGVKSFENRRFS